MAGPETYGAESQGMNFDTQSRDVLLLKLSSQVALDKGGLLTTWWSVMYLRKLGGCAMLNGRERTFPVPPSPTRTSLKVGMALAAAAGVVPSAMLEVVLTNLLGYQDFHRQGRDSSQARRGGSQYRS